MAKKNYKQRTYDEKSVALAKRYNSISAHDVYPYYFDFLKNITLSERQNIKILELGAGAGRDAFKMAEMGFDVWAVDGSENMLAQARLQKPHKKITYIHDIAPALSIIVKDKSLKNHFNIIYMNAFMFHLDTQERSSLFKVLDHLAKDHVSIFMSFKNVGFKEDGRTFYPIAPEDIEKLGEEFGYTAHIFDPLPDELGRDHVEWTYLRLTR